MQNVLPIAAIVISFLALIVSAISLGWNIYRDVVLKPKVIAEASIRQMVGTDGPVGNEIVMISAVNHSAGQVTIVGTLLEKASLWQKIIRRGEKAVVLPNWTHPVNSKLPCKIGMSEQMQLVFPFEKDCFLSWQPTRIGLGDSFGRTHWVRQSDVMRLNKKYRESYSLPVT